MVVREDVLPCYKASSFRTQKVGKIRPRFTKLDLKTFVEINQNPTDIDLGNCTGN